jgi:TetR/AcrR family transcriptional regulator, copper-responsive repressor
MGRPKEFTREDVLRKAIPVFWEQGYADTGVHELEKATGVNKSGLYSEFKSKEDLFLCCLEHYLKATPGREILSKQPLGWDNVEEMLRGSLLCKSGQKGCFAISSMREFAILPRKAHEIIAKHRAEIKELLVKNIREEKTRTDATVLAELIETFLSGLCMEQYLESERRITEREIHALMKAMRGS